MIKDTPEAPKAAAFGATPASSAGSQLAVFGVSFRRELPPTMLPPKDSKTAKIIRTADDVLMAKKAQAMTKRTNMTALYDPWL